MQRAAIAAVSCLWLCSAAEAAAPRPAKSPPPAADAADLFGGYSFTRSGEAALNGVQFSAALPYRRSLRLVADVSAHAGSFADVHLHQLTFLAGLRFSPKPTRPRRLRPYGQALIGGAHTSSRFDTSGAAVTSSSNAWGGALGGGADYGLSRRWAVRGQGELLLLHGGGAWECDPRLSLGAVYHFGR